MGRESWAVNPLNHLKERETLSEWRSALRRLLDDPGQIHHNQTTVFPGPSPTISLEAELYN
jgi:hypothetical protein